MATFDLDPQDMKLIARAMDALPISDTADVVTKIQAQIDAQPGSEWDAIRSAKTVEDLL